MANYHSSVIDREIVIEAQAVSFGSTVIDSGPFINAAAHLLLTEYIPLNLEYASNGKANFSCYCPARQVRSLRR